MGRSGAGFSQHSQVPTLGAPPLLHRHSFLYARHQLEDVRLFWRDAELTLVVAVSFVKGENG